MVLHDAYQRCAAESAVKKLEIERKYAELMQNSEYVEETCNSKAGRVK